MGICFNDICMNDATQRCSVCKTATYCSGTCQKKHWSSHKKECKINKLLFEMQQKQEEEENKRGPPPRPRITHCTGCNGKFKEDWLEVDQECPDCGYITCESCSCHNSKGTCYCPGSNFGSTYCNREPKSYHFCGRNGRSYSGDYHPDSIYELNKENHPEAFEKETRACNNCGEIVHCLKKEYRNY